MNTAAVIVFALLQCHAGRNGSGCETMSYHPTMAECRQLAREYRHLDGIALRVSQLPILVSYQCIKRRL